MQNNIVHQTTIVRICSALNAKASIALGTILLFGIIAKVESGSIRMPIDSFPVYDGKFRDKIRLFDIDSSFSSGCNSIACYADILQSLKIGKAEYSLVRSRFNQTNKVYLVSKRGRKHYFDGIFESAPDSFYQAHRQLRMVWIDKSIGKNDIRYSAKKGEYMFLIQPSEVLSSNHGIISDSIEQESLRKLHSQLVIDSIKQWSANCLYLRSLSNPLYCLDFVEYHYMNNK